MPTDPYFGLARLYDAEYDGATGDIAGYARRGESGPLLVAGCGTGRVCRGLEDHRRVVGFDRSPDMIARARSHPRAGSTRYEVADLLDVSLGRFAEAIVPNGTFAFLETRDQQIRALERLRESLVDGGVLTLDLPMPDFALLGVPHTPERLAWEGVLDDQPVRRTREVFRDAARARLRLVDRYYVDGERVATSELALRLVFPHEAEWMLEAGGFVLDAAWGDHREGPVRPGCPRLVLRALKV